MEENNKKIAEDLLKLIDKYGQKNVQQELEKIVVDKSIKDFIKTMKHW